MTSLRTFLRIANAQFISLINATIRALQRERRAQFFALVGTCFLVACVVTYALQSARHHQRQWASNTFVLVASSSIAANETLTKKNTRLVEVPLAVVADDALRTIPTGARLRTALRTATPITASMISVDGARIDLPDGWRGVALPADLIAPQVASGDRVDVIAADQVIAPNALVIEVSPSQGITIAVPAESAAVVATATRTGIAGIVLAGR